MNALQFVRVLRWSTVLLRNVSEACIHTLMQIEGDLEGEFVARKTVADSAAPVEKVVPDSPEELGEFDDHPPSGDEMFDANDD